MTKEARTYWTAPSPAHDGSWINLRLSWHSTISAKSCLTATVASRMWTCREKQSRKLSTSWPVISNTGQHSTRPQHFVATVSRLRCLLGARKCIWPEW